MTPPGWAYAAATILGMAAVTVIARNFFLFARRETRIPERYALQWRRGDRRRDRPGDLHGPRRADRRLARRAPAGGRRRDCSTPGAGVLGALISASPSTAAAPVLGW
jgi:hypothetical protein